MSGARILGSVQAHELLREELGDVGGARCAVVRRTEADVPDRRQLRGDLVGVGVVLPVRVRSVGRQIVMRLVPRMAVTEADREIVDKRMLHDRDLRFRKGLPHFEVAAYRERWRALASEVSSLEEL